MWCRMCAAGKKGEENMIKKGSEWVGIIVACKH